MPRPLHTLVPLGLSGCLTLTGVAVMLAGPGVAAPLPTQYSATATGDLWHVKQLDRDLSDSTPAAQTDLSVFHVSGLMSSKATPRSTAAADNLAGTTASDQGARRGVSSAATRSADTSGPAVGIAPSGAISGMLDVDQATLGARGRWVGDRSCLTTADGLADATAVGNGASLAPGPIPSGDAGGIVLPTDLPSDIPTTLPSSTASGLPTSTPTILPTASGTPTIIPTDLPTVVSTTTGVPLPTLTLPPLPSPTLPLLQAPTGESAQAAGSDVILAALGAGTVQQRVDLPLQNGAKHDDRGVRAQAIGTVKDTSAPAMTFFGGEVEVRVNGPARLTAYADGVHPSVLDWAPPVVTVRVPAQDKTYALPASGSPITVTYSKNSAVTLTLSVGTLTKATNGSAYDVGGRASVMHMVVTDGSDTALEGDFLPMEAQAHAPGNGVECPIPDTDRDGLNDALEAKLGTKPGVPDTDRDGLKDGVEHFRFHTNPLRADTDRDKLTDGQEIKKYKTNARKKDTDRDGLTDGLEVRRWHTNPRKKDTDRDGMSDGAEVRHHRNPLRKGR